MNIKCSLVGLCLSVACLALNQSIHARAGASERIVVTGEEVPSSYGAPPAFSRSRFQSLTNAYVLPPWAFFFGVLFGIITLLKITILQ